MSAGMLQARITVPVGGWVMIVAITAVVGSPFTVTIPAGNYYPSELLVELQTQLDAATVADGAWSVVADLSDTTGTGLVNIKNNIQTFTIVWTSTDLRDVLGFTATLTPAAITFFGTKHLRGAFLPDCPIDSEYGGEAGHTETDRSSLVSGGGVTTVTAYGVDRVAMSPTRWSHVTRAKARTSGESPAGYGGSYETWLLDTHSGRYSYFGTSPPVRVYHDAGGSVVGTYRLIWNGSTANRRSESTWIGLWPIDLPPGYVI